MGCYLPPWTMLSRKLYFTRDTRNGVVRLRRAPVSSARNVNGNVYNVRQELTLPKSPQTIMTRDLILGTAGHIDHGKTSLVKALTGIDCDRLPEEKARGITIDIGFAILDLGPYRLGIVD